MKVVWNRIGVKCFILTFQSKKYYLSMQYFSTQYKPLNINWVISFKSIILLETWYTEYWTSVDIFTKLQSSVASRVTYSYQRDIYTTWNSPDSNIRQELARTCPKIWCELFHTPSLLLLSRPAVVFKTNQIPITKFLFWDFLNFLCYNWFRKVGAKNKSKHHVILLIL